MNFHSIFQFANFYLREHVLKWKSRNLLESWITILQNVAGLIPMISSQYNTATKLLISQFTPNIYHSGKQTKNDVHIQQ